MNLIMYSVFYAIYMTIYFIDCIGIEFKIRRVCRKDRSIFGRKKGYGFSPHVENFVRNNFNLKFSHLDD
jgi:hypothetical protein